MMITVMGELLSMSVDDNNDAIDHLKPKKRKHKSNISECHLFSLKEGKVKYYLSCICHLAISPTFLKGSPCLYLLFIDLSVFFMLREGFFISFCLISNVRWFYMIENG